MSAVLFKAAGIWFVIAVAAIANGVFREKVLVHVLGPGLALPLSGVLLAILVFLVTLMSVSFIGLTTAAACFRVGLLWVALTLSFEFLFGHYVAGKAWQEILQVFNVRQGELFVVVLLVTALSPWLAAKARAMF